MFYNNSRKEAAEMEWMDCGEEEALLKECQWAEEHVKDEDVPQPAPDELEMIIKRIEEECRR